MPVDLILLRGGGDLASGIALRLHRAGFQLVISELPQPLAVRRTVAFSEAVYNGTQEVEGVTGRLVIPEGIQVALDGGEIPVVVDPLASLLSNAALPWAAVIDARMVKRVPDPLPAEVPLHIGLGPGFEARLNCSAVIETRRSHTLGRVFWEGKAQSDSGLPEGDPRRVLRAPMFGTLTARAQIGEHVEPGQVVASIYAPGKGERIVTSHLSGVLRGLIRDGIEVQQDVKIGDVDPRDDPRLCYLVSDKSLAVAGGVLEALLTFGISNTARM